MKTWANNPQARTELFFKISVFLKGISAVGELMAGVAVLILPLSDIARELLLFAQGELAEDPNDFIATTIVRFAHAFSVHWFESLGLYLLLRGAVKFGLVIALLKRLLWAYPASLAIIGAAMLYQTYLIVTTHSVVQTVLTILDIFVVWFIWKEYQLLRAGKALKPE